MELSAKIDLHMHSSVSDGTDSPAELLQKVKDEDIALFSVTDHDAVKACSEIISLLDGDSPAFFTGAEFSCRDEDGKYHILGYGYDPDSDSMKELTDAGHAIRIGKLQRRLDLLKEEYGIEFPDHEVDELRKLDNPGKPHLGNLMAKYGFAEDRNTAIRNVLNNLHVKSEYIRPETAIDCILRGGGIPVLAHPAFGDGDQLIMNDEMDRRLKKLTSMGLQGVEAFYSGFSPRLMQDMIDFAEKYGLYVTAGSDYHGKNKLIKLGDTGIDYMREVPMSLYRFIRDIQDRMYGIF
ncbi:MAG: PHP domain-containing protein [Oscillospiraceae bacterium]|nr:PHP domain-containing protein [Oscillospiraceae bacterium]